jgi:hypothetical protein
MVKSSSAIPPLPRWPYHPDNSHPALQLTPFLGFGEEHHDLWTVGNFKSLSRTDSKIASSTSNSQYQWDKC